MTVAPPSGTLVGPKRIYPERSFPFAKPRRGWPNAARITNAKLALPQSRQLFLLLDVMGSETSPSPRADNCFASDSSVWWMQHFQGVFNADTREQLPMFVVELREPAYLVCRFSVGVGQSTEIAIP